MSRKPKMTLPKKRGRKPKAKLSAAAIKALGATVKKIETPGPLKGFKDILPLEVLYWKFIREKVSILAKDYNFKMIETPILENLTLFKRGLGKYTDIVEKEMFQFTNKGGKDVVLRPEGTASVVRAYINHGMHNLPQPLKVFYDGPMFRYENTQSGRLREHHQVGFEVLGSANPATDAQLILIGYNLLEDLGISFNLQINSVGCVGCRGVFRESLVEYYRSVRKDLCDDCKRRLNKNPLRLLDCKEESCQSVKESAPQIVDYLDDNCKKHFMQVLEYLDELEIPYNLNPFLVRGLDYYTKTVFEFWPSGEKKSQSALFGGGRYDNLVEELGGLETPGVGFSAGIERLILRIKDEGVIIPTPPRLDVFVAQLGVEAKKKTMLLFEELRNEGFEVVENFAKDSLKQQLEDADKLKVRFVLILGQKELQEKTILLRDMDAGVQEIIDQKKVVSILRSKLEGFKVKTLEETEDPSLDEVKKEEK